MTCSNRYRIRDINVASRANIAGGQNDGGLTPISLLQTLTVSDLCPALMSQSYVVSYFCLLFSVSLFFICFFSRHLCYEHDLRYLFSMLLLYMNLHTAVLHASL